MDTFEQRLRFAMEQKGFKAADVIRLAAPEAEKRGIKIGKSHMSQYLSGKTKPRRAALEVLAMTLDVEPGWLAGGDGKPEDAKRAAAAGGGTYLGMNGKAAIYSAAGSPETNKDAVKAGEDLNTLAANETAKDSGDGFHKAEGKAAGDGGDYKLNLEGHNKMKTFSKSKKLDNVLYDVRGPVVDEAMRMEEQGIHVLKLNIGNPAPFGFRTPDEVVYDMSRQLPACEGYSDSKGLFSARKAIMQYSQIKEIPNVAISDIYTGNGVSELINMSMQALLDDGDEVLVPAPDYPLWTACVTLSGGKAVHYICDEQAEWYPDINDMKSKITDRTKAIVIINPNNPTGALYPVEILEEIVKIAREHQLIIFSDEIYDRLVMDGLKHTSIASLAPDLFCVTFSGLSKSHMIAGYRIGWMILSGRKQLAKDYIEGLNMLSNMRLCSNVPAQSIVQTALWGHQSVAEYVVPGGRIFEQREFVYKALNDIPGISVVKPKASFYAFPKIDTKKFNITDDEQFALDLLKDKKVLIVHGRGFNWKEPDHFRVVFLPRVEVLKDAMHKLEDFLSYYQQ